MIKYYAYNVRPAQNRWNCMGLLQLYGIAEKCMESQKLHGIAEKAVDCWNCMGLLKSLTCVWLFHFSKYADKNQSILELRSTTKALNIPHYSMSPT